MSQTAGSHKSLLPSALAALVVFVVAVALGTMVGLITDEPDWLPAAVSGGFIGLAWTAIILRWSRSG